VVFLCVVGKGFVGGFLGDALHRGAKGPRQRRDCRCECERAYRQRAQSAQTGSIEDFPDRRCRRNSVDETNVLANGARQNLRSSQFDAVQRANPIGITYSYVNDSTLPPGLETQVHSDLPSQITIVGKPFP
jgi:hypothetical protein